MSYHWAGLQWVKVITLWSVMCVAFLRVFMQLFLYWIHDQTGFLEDFIQFLLVSLRFKWIRFTAENMHCVICLQLWGTPPIFWSIIPKHPRSEKCFPDFDHYLGFRGPDINFWVEQIAKVCFIVDSSLLGCYWWHIQNGTRVSTNKWPNLHI